MDGPQEMKESKQQPSMLPGPAVPEGGSTVVGQIHFVVQIDFSRKFPATVKPVLGSVILEVRGISPGKSVMSF